MNNQENYDLTKDLENTINADQVPEVPFLDLSKLQLGTSKAAKPSPLEQDQYHKTLGEKPWSEYIDTLSNVAHRWKIQTPRLLQNNVVKDSTKLMKRNTYAVELDPVYSSASEEVFYESSAEIQQGNNRIPQIGKQSEVKEGYLSLKLLEDTLCPIVNVETPVFQSQPLLDDESLLDLSMCSAVNVKHYGPFHDIIEIGDCTSPEGIVLNILEKDFEALFQNSDSTWKRLIRFLRSPTTQEIQQPHNNDGFEVKDSTTKETQFSLDNFLI